MSEDHVVINEGAKVKTLIAITTLAALLAAAPAQAGQARNPNLPEPETHRIVPARSIGGVGLGGKLGEAERTWGGKGYCRTKLLPDSCFWGDFAYANEGRAEILADNGVVEWVQISWNGLREGGKPDLEPAIRRFRTRGGLGLASRLADVGKAFPNAERIHKPSNGRVQAYVIHRDGRQMWFGGGKLVEYVSLLPE